MISFLSVLSQIIYYLNDRKSPVDLLDVSKPLLPSQINWRKMVGGSVCSIPVQRGSCLRWGYFWSLSFFKVVQHYVWKSQQKSNFRHWNGAIYNFETFVYSYWNLINSSRFFRILLCSKYAEFCANSKEFSRVQEEFAKVLVKNYRISLHSPQWDFLSGFHTSWEWNDFRI